MQKKAFVIMLLTGLVVLGAAPMKTQAASAWSFKAGTEQIDKDGSITMTYQQYKNFDLLKNNKIVTDAADNYDDYKIVWKSSNEDAVWINKHTGQARANKFDNLTEDQATVTISAVIKNNKTGKQITRSFTVEVDNSEFTKSDEEVIPEPTTAPEPEVVQPTPTLPVEETESADNKTTSYSKKGIKKLTLGSTWQTDVAVLLDTFDFYYEGKVIGADYIMGVETVDCVTSGTPVEKIYIRTLDLKVRIQGLHSEWDDPNQTVIERVEINQLFRIE